METGRNKNTELDKKEGIETEIGLETDTKTRHALEAEAGTETETEGPGTASLPAHGRPASCWVARAIAGRNRDRASCGTSAPVPADIAPATVPSFLPILDVPSRRGHLCLDHRGAAPERDTRPRRLSLPDPGTPTSSPALGALLPPAGPSTAARARGARSYPAAHPGGQGEPRPRDARGALTASAAPSAAARGFRGGVSHGWASGRTCTRTCTHTLLVTKAEPSQGKGGTSPLCHLRGDPPPAR